MCGIAAGRSNVASVWSKKRLAVRVTRFARQMPGNVDQVLVLGRAGGRCPSWSQVHKRLHVVGQRNVHRGHKRHSPEPTIAPLANFAKDIVRRGIEVTEVTPRPVASSRINRKTDEDGRLVEKTFQEMTIAELRDPALIGGAGYRFLPGGAGSAGGVGSAPLISRPSWRGKKEQPFQPHHASCALASAMKR
jgi:hypothetical protein